MNADSPASGNLMNLLRLATKNVFVDASLHVGAKFSYSSGSFKRLAALAEADVVRVFDTLVDLGEIRSNIAIAAEAAGSALRKFRKEAIGLKEQSELGGLFTSTDTEEIERHLLNGYTAYRQVSRATQLALTTPDEIFAKYFSVEPPFDTGAKRSEFPDAFIIGSLERWCRENGQSMYVLSADAGMRSAARTAGLLVPLERLEQFLDLVVSEKHQSVAIKLQRWLLEWRPNLTERITKAFEETGFYVEDADGDAEDIEVEEVAASEPLLVEVTDQEGVFEIPTEITFTAYLSYDDPDSWVYDSEDKTAYFLRRRRVRVRRTEDVTVELVVDTSAAAGLPSPKRVTLNRGEDIPVSIEDELVEDFAEPGEDDFSWLDAPE